MPFQVIFLKGNNEIELKKVRNENGGHRVR